MHLLAICIFVYINVYSLPVCLLLYLNMLTVAVAQSRSVVSQIKRALLPESGSVDLLEHFLYDFVQLLSQL